MDTRESDPRASALFGQKRYPEAEQAFREILRSDPGDVSGLVGLAFVLTVLDRTGECESLLSSAFAIDSAEALWSAAQYLVMLGQFHEARRNLLELVNTNQEAAKKADVWYLLGFSCVMVEDMAGAEAYARMATELGPGDGRYWHNLGWVLRTKGKEADAEEAFEWARSFGYERPKDQPV